MTNDAFQSSGIERCFAPFGCAQIAHIDFAELRYERAREQNSDDLARQYISDLRVICETLLKHATAEFPPNVLYNQKFTLGSLRKDIIKLGIKERRDPFTDSVFIDLESVMTEDGPVMKLLSEPHHSDSDQITVLQATKARAFWRVRLFPAVKVVWEHFRLHRKRFIGEVEAIRLPTNCNHKPAGLSRMAKLTPRLIGNVSAYSDGRAASGAMGFASESGDERRMSLSGLSGYRLERDTLSRAAEIGDVLLVHLRPGVNTNNLVVEDRGSFLVARRYEKDPAYPDIAVLTAASANPLRKEDALFTREHGANRRKVAGVIFHEGLKMGPLMPAESDVTPLDADLLAAVVRSSSLLEVLGDSAQPKALDRQYLLVAPEQTDLQLACRQLHGKPVVFLDHNDDAFFKRLRYVDDDRSRSKA